MQDKNRLNVKKVKNCVVFRMKTIFKQNFHAQSKGCHNLISPSEIFGPCSLCLRRLDMLAEFSPSRQMNTLTNKPSRSHTEVMV